MKKLIKRIYEMSFWDILAWLCYAFILVWLTLKMLGIINTPVWLEYAPIYTAMYVAGWAASKLKMVSNDVEMLKRDMGRLKGDMILVKSDMMLVKGDIRVIKSNCPNC